jgi:hypothetical protein
MTAQAQAWWELSAKPVKAWRRRWLQAQRKTTPRLLPEATVTGQTPALAASWSAVRKCSRMSPNSAGIWAAQRRPARGKDMTRRLSGGSATKVSTIRLESRSIAMGRWGQLGEAAEHVDQPLGVVRDHAIQPKPSGKLQRKT